MNEENNNGKTLVKLMKARKILRDKHPEKTGKNPIFDYFELRDFLPATLDAFDEVGLGSTPLCCNNEQAWIDVVDLESGEGFRTFCPMSSAALPKCHPVQNLGAVKSYLRRYIWMDIMEICDKDPVDSAPPAEKAQEQVGPTPRAKPPVPTQKTPPRGVQRQETASAEGTIEWRGYIIEAKPVSGKKANGEEYLFYAMKMTTSDGKQVEATTFDEDRYTRASFWPQDDEVIMVVKPRLGKPDKFNFVGLKEIDSELELAAQE